jgi:hypothetical protein
MSRASGLGPGAWAYQARGPTPQPPIHNTQAKT